jgi:hypothetical protein
MVNKEKDRTLKTRTVIRVPFFADEFESLGLSKDNTYYEAVAIIRSKTGCVIGARNRSSGVSKSALFTQFNSATEEQKKAISKLLAQDLDQNS